MAYIRLSEGLDKGFSVEFAMKIFINCEIHVIWDLTVLFGVARGDVLLNLLLLVASGCCDPDGRHHASGAGIRRSGTFVDC